jgi:hypothetical protein
VVGERSLAGLAFEVEGLISANRLGLSGHLQPSTNPLIFSVSVFLHQLSFQGLPWCWRDFSAIAYRQHYEQRLPA